MESKFFLGVHNITLLSVLSMLTSDDVLSAGGSFDVLPVALSFLFSAVSCVFVSQSLCGFH